jgi:tRNA pseudouridine38-40 synthase
VRVAIGIEYDGAAFSGWQVQLHARSVQGDLQRALARVADHDIRLTAAGRTDAGVHALRQVAHFDTRSSRSERAWVLGSNSNSESDVSVLWARSVPESFHARYSAQWRRYVYRIQVWPVRPALDRNRACWSRKPLDVRLMQEAARHLLGEHDFSAFRAAECQAATAVRNVMAIEVRHKHPFVEIDIQASAFLQHMVRNIAGSLMTVGSGARPPGWLAEVLASRERRVAGVTAPAAGLYLVDVGYPDQFNLPMGPAEPDSITTCPRGGGGV